MTVPKYLFFLMLADAELVSAVSVITFLRVNKGRGCGMILLQTKSAQRRPLSPSPS